MPPKDTFDTREKLRVLLRLSLCWGVHITSEAFGIELAKYGITTARGRVEYGTIRSKLITMLGSDYNYFLPAETIGAFQGMDTAYEVRLRTLKTPPRKLKATVLDTLRNQGFFEDKPSFVNLLQLEMHGSLSLEIVDELPGDLHYSEPITGPERRRTRLSQRVMGVSARSPFKVGKSGYETFTGATILELQENEIQLPLPNDCHRTIHRANDQMVSVGPRMHVKYVRTDHLRKSFASRASSVCKFSEWKQGSVATPSITEDATEIIGRGLVAFEGAADLIAEKKDNSPDYYDELVFSHMGSWVTDEMLLSASKYVSHQNFPVGSSAFEHLDMSSIITSATRSSSLAEALLTLGFNHSLLQSSSIDVIGKAAPRDCFGYTLGNKVQSMLASARSYPKELTDRNLALNSTRLNESCTTQIRNWSIWLSRAKTEAPHHWTLLERVQKAIDRMMEEDLQSLDDEGDSILHSLISSIERLGMRAADVRQVLQSVFEKAGGGLMTTMRFLGLRNKDGLTPLHLAVKSALPHVVAELMLQEAACYCVTMDGRNHSTRIQDIARRFTVIEDNDGTTLMEDLSSTYWLARASDEEVSMLMEVDALLCVCLVTDALAGRLPRKEHQFRPLRKWYKESSNRKRKRKHSDEALCMMEELINSAAMSDV